MLDVNHTMQISHERIYKRVLLQARGEIKKELLGRLRSSQNSFTCKNTFSFLYGRKKIMICTQCGL
ncbi:MAG: hypothetical protein ACI9RO_001365 [Alteromonas macleodii]|jgi:hypothetical protein